MRVNGAEILHFFHLELKNIAKTQRVFVVCSVLGEIMQLIDALCVNYTTFWIFGDSKTKNRHCQPQFACFASGRTVFGYVGGQDRLYWTVLGV